MCWVCEPPQSFGQRQALVSHTQEHFRPVPASQQANDYVGPSSKPESMGLDVDSCNEELNASDSQAEEADSLLYYTAEEADSLPEQLIIEEPDRRVKIKRFDFFLANNC